MSDLQVLQVLHVATILLSQTTSSYSPDVKVTTLGALLMLTVHPTDVGCKNLSLIYSVNSLFLARFNLSLFLLGQLNILKLICWQSTLFQ